MALSNSEIKEKLAAIKKQAEKVQSTFNAYKANKSKSKSKSSSSSSSRVTSDSSSARRDQDSIRDEIEDNLRDQQRKIERQIERERAALAKRVEEEKLSINTRFDETRDDTEFQQERETGQTSTNLARAGGFLGVTASQEGVLQNLSNVQQREIQSLENSREEALRAANGAYEDRDFELARESLQIARDIEQEIYNRTFEFDQQFADQNAAERDRLETTERQNTIFNAIETSGSKSPEDIFRELDGTVPIEEINSFLNGIVPDSAVGDGYKFTGSDTAALLGSGMGADDIAAFNQYINENGYDDFVRGNLTPAQRTAADKIFRDVKTTTGKDSPSAPLSILDLQRIEETYGVLFPLGVSAGEVTKFLQDNAGASPSEMQNALDSIFGTQAGNGISQDDFAIDFTEDWFRNNLTRSQLKGLADLVGASKWWTYKTFDIDRMFETPEFWSELQNKIENLRNEGITDAEILIALTQ